MKPNAAILSLPLLLGLSASAHGQAGQPAPVPSPEVEEATVIEPAPEAPEEEAEPLDRTPKFSGSVRPVFVVRHRPTALPQDRWDTGVDSTTGVGLQVEGVATDKVGYVARLELSLSQIEVSTPDPNAPTANVIGNPLERAVVYYKPIEGLTISGGRVRVQFTYEDGSPAASTIFPNRVGVGDAFSYGLDLGAEVQYALPEGFGKAVFGVYNGNGLGAGALSERGPLYVGRFDFHPLGKVPRMHDTEKEKFRIGGGLGVGYRPTKVFDGSRRLSGRRQDLRLTGSLGAAFQGLAVVAEFLRSDAWDNITAQSPSSVGRYIQVSYFAKGNDKVGFGPMYRTGNVTIDQFFFPRDTVWHDLGFTTYFFDGDTNHSRIILNYFSENRQTEGERARGGQLQYQINF